MISLRTVLLPLACWMFLSAARGEEPPAADWSPGRTDEQGVITHEIRSRWQAGPTLARVLLPKARRGGEKLPVVYVLPVEPGAERRFGDGLEEVVKRGLADKHGTIFVAPTFSALPWYADHPTDERLQQEKYLLQAVLPAVERHYPARAEREGRLLLGFSKSGWGAWSLLLRHPDVFGRAAAWDAPLMKERPDQFGMGPIFGTQENFERYQITRLLADRAAAWKQESPRRLIVLGHGSFRSQHEQLQAVLKERQIPHRYIDGPTRKHDWHSGWVAEAAAELFAKDE